jgi:magnesium transporter
MILMNPASRQRSKGRGGIGSKLGLAPGTMMFVGDQRRARIRIDVIDYNDVTFNEMQDLDVRQCTDLTRSSLVTWINVSGVHDVVLIESLGHSFGLHPLTLEDIVNTTQRPKYEEFPQYMFIALKMIEIDVAPSHIFVEHVSLILGENYVISFLEDEGDVFDAIRHRIRTATGRIRMMKADYLAFCLMDAVIDHYFVAVEHIGDRIDEFEEKILSDPKREDVNEIHRLKRSILTLRKAVWPFREEVGAIGRSGSALLRAETSAFWRDLYDHVIQVIDMVETCRDIMGGIHDTYLSGLSNRMNEVMKVLTIISTIFIPLTFIVGVYGMNFKHMPELDWPPGYFVVWGVMLAISACLFGFFKRQKWL